MSRAWVARALALAALGLLVFAGLTAALASPAATLPGDREALAAADALHAEGVERVVAVVTELGSFALTAALVAATATWSLARRRPVEALVLVVGFLLAWLAVDVVKEAVGRARPARPHVDTTTAAYPSGHAAHAVALVACALVLVRGARRVLAAALAVLLVAVVGASRIYLRAHYLSDVLGGVALAGAVFALVGALAGALAFLKTPALPAEPSL